ncbi:hypothetical protein [Segatella sp.]|uniref:hypothetical protein n=1 Tax=Segatella sp. TaxID=2974253 RepID=UPI003AB92CDD
MKKTLLVSAFSAIAMVSGAQTEVASAVGDFDFITKNFTVGQKTIPYSLVKDEQNGKYEITFYNTVFNKERTILVPLKEVKYYPTKTYTASLPVNKLTMKESSDNGDLFTPDKPLETLDDFAKYIKENIYYGPDFVPFADAQGNWYFVDDNDYYSNEFDGRSKIFKYFGYYDKKSNQVYVRFVARVDFEVDDSNIEWNEGSAQGEVFTPILKKISLKDYDVNCAESFDSYVTQNLFNQDEKFEFVTQSYREVASDGNSGIQNSESPYQINGLSGNSPVAISISRENKAYESYISVIGEDGEEIVNLPDGSYDLHFIKLDGKLYMTVNTAKDGQEQTIIYSVDNVNTSITELARTTPVKARKLFNSLGMQVGKNAKGLVIQQGGIKYFNK